MVTFPSRSAIFLSVAIAVLQACSSSPDEQIGLMCPPPGTAQAALLTEPDFFLEGPGAVGGAGDYLLRNDQAAFIISGPGREISYYHYEGIVVDAVAMDGCAQAAEENFQELGLLFGQLDLGTFHDSTMRAFRGETFEVINDGSDGGPAHLRVTGVDDYYWLVEYALIKEAFLAEDVKPLSAPYGIRIEVDYILEPGSSTLRMDIALHSESDQSQRFMSAAAVLFGNQLPVRRYARSTFEFGGFNLVTGIPWISAAAGHGAYAFGKPDAEMAFISISGMNAILNLNQLFNDPLTVRPGPDAEPARTTYLLSVGDTDAHSATRGLQPHLERPIRGYPYTLTAFTGKVLETGTGTPITDAAIHVQLEDESGNWDIVESYVSDGEGRFGDDIADFGHAGRIHRLVVEAPGRVTPPHVEFVLPQASPLEVEMGLAGRLDYDITETHGHPLPAKISLFQEGRHVKSLFVMGQGSAPLAPGTYEVSVTRGFEHEPHHDDALVIPEGGAATLQVELPRVLDISGYLSIDTHVHSAPSPDSQVFLGERIMTAAAAGLHVPVATDHEIIVGLQQGLEETGMHEWVFPLTGQEVTATLPEHTTMFPVEPDGTHRGGFLPWYQLGLSGLYDTAFGRGADITILNHPKAGGGCDYLCLIEWDRVKGEPTLQDPVALGLPPGTPLWTWDFTGIEYLNGIRPVFLDPENIRNTGLFDDWQSFLNHGHRIVAVASSDEHGYEKIGEPRNYFKSPTDMPQLLHEEDVVDAFYAGDILVSTGAFARVSIHGGGMGSLVSAIDGKVTVDLLIEALPDIDVTHFRVYTNCDEALKMETTNPDGIVKFDGSVDIELPTIEGQAIDTHITVLGFGEKNLPRGLRQFDARNIPRFTTNAIFVDANGNGAFDPPGGKECSYTLD